MIAIADTDDFEKVIRAALASIDDMPPVAQEAAVRIAVDFHCIADALHFIAFGQRRQ
jgi:hypothetical protein